MDKSSIDNLSNLPNLWEQVSFSDSTYQRWQTVCDVSAVMYAHHLAVTGTPKPSEEELWKMCGMPRAVLMGSVMVIWCDSPSGRIVMPLLPHEWRYKIPQPSMN